MHNRCAKEAAIMAQPKRRRRSRRTRIGNVSVYEHHGSWWVYFREEGKQNRRCIGPDENEARTAAAQANAQLAAARPTLFSFTPVGVDELRRRWLDHHEHVLRSSVATLNRYRTAAGHLCRFLDGTAASRPAHEVNVTAFVRHLRGLQVAPNGHRNAVRRPLRDKGIQFILATCRSMYNYAAKQRLLPPYFENPFAAIPIDRLPVDDAKPIHIFGPAEEKAFLEACDGWQWPVFYILAKVGLRSGELTHLLIEDVDFGEGSLHIRNKPKLGWQVKTRNIRSIPLPTEPMAVLRHVAAGRQAGVLFVRRRFLVGDIAPLANMGSASLAERLAKELRGSNASRAERLRAAKRLWREAGAIKTDTIRTEFMKLARRISLPDVTAPKCWRHTFATLMQGGRRRPVNPSIDHGPCPRRRRPERLGDDGHVYAHPAGSAPPATPTGTQPAADDGRDYQPTPRLRRRDPDTRRRPPMLNYNTPLRPRNADLLKVLTIGRVSTDKQDIHMLDVQQAEVRKALAGMYDGEIDLTSLGEQVSGDVALRESYVEACELIETRQFDLVILFDLSKAARLPQWMHHMIDLCIDCETRFISLGDGIDTADEHWETAAGAAAITHGTHNAYTRRRIKAKGDWAFKNGGQVTKVPAGFRKLSQEEADSAQFGPKGLRIVKTPEFTPVVRRMRDMVLSGETYEAIARWLNEEGVSKGPFAKSNSWKGKRVSAYLRQPLLHGERQRSKYQTVRLRASNGVKRSINDKPMVMKYEELAHLTKAEHEELLAEMDRRIADHPRTRRAEVGPKGRARSRTYWPGQQMTCGVCGSPFYWRGAVGLQCSNCGNPEDAGCWNHVQPNAALVRRHIRDILLDLLRTDADRAMSALRDAALAEFDRLNRRENQEAERLEAKAAKLRGSKANLAKAIAAGGQIRELLALMQEAETELKHVEKQLAKAESQSVAHPALPEPDEVEEHLPGILDHLLTKSYEFAALLRRVIPRFVIEPWQMVDSCRPVARARVTFSFGALEDPRPPREYEPRAGDFSVTLDLFEPSAAVRCLDLAVRLQAKHPTWSAEKIAKVITRATGQQTRRWDVRAALQLRAKMQEQGVTDYIVPITDPGQVSRWRMENTGKVRWDQIK